MPDYEQSLLSSIREYVEPGDEVLDIGGGFGVATVAAAKAAGSTGHVRCYEGSREHQEIIHEATDLNQVSERVSVIPELVGRAYDVWGEAGDRIRDPSQLEPADVLILDCEGAEQDIVPGLEIRPRIAIIEVHPQHGATVGQITAELDKKGYAIQSERNTEGTVPGTILVATHGNHN